MLLMIDLTSETPLYQQLRDRVVEAIAAGRLAAGSSLPSTRQLAADFGINFHTVNKAYDLLRREGFVRLTRKQGAVVQRDNSTAPAEPAFVEDWEARTRTLLAESYAKGMSQDEILRRCREILASFGDTSQPDAPATEKGLHS